MSFIANVNSETRVPVPLSVYRYIVYTFSRRDVHKVFSECVGCISCFACFVAVRGDGGTCCLEFRCGRIILPEMK